MSSEQKPSSYIAENGITLGVIALSLVVIFGVGLPRWIHDDGGSSASKEKIVLPSSLSGGYVAADTAANWKDAIGKKQVDQQTATSMQQQASQISKQAAKNVDTIGAGAATRMYVDIQHQSLLVVSAVRDHDAFVQGLTGDIKKVGDSLCNTGQSGVECRRTSDDLTVDVQVQSQAAPTSETVVKQVDEVWDKVS